MACLTPAAVQAQPAEVSISSQVAPKWKRILGSKHDLTQLNKRAGMDAMEGVAYSNYGDPCLYCHLPPGADEGAGKPGRLKGWNRLRPVTDRYVMYNSPTMDEPKPVKPSDISLLCLSCHDGTMAVDQVVYKPRTWTNGKQSMLHMRLHAGDDLESCGKCHDGIVAHDITVKALGHNFMDDHPISIPYAGLNPAIKGFKAPDTPQGFKNGVRLYQGRVECPTCHDIHNPDAKMLLRTKRELLCSTCHNN